MIIGLLKEQLIKYAALLSIAYKVLQINTCIKMYYYSLSTFLKGNRHPNEGLFYFLQCYFLSVGVAKRDVIVRMFAAFIGRNDHAL